MEIIDQINGLFNVTDDGIVLQFLKSISLQQVLRLQKIIRNNNEKVFF